MAGRNWRTVAKTAMILLSLIGFGLYLAPGDPSASSVLKQLIVDDAGWQVLERDTGFDADIGSDGGIKLNREFKLPPFSGDQFSQGLLSPSGYPLANVQSQVPACQNPYQGKEAREAWKSGDRQWMEKLHGCYLLGEGLRVEWLSFRDRYHLNQFPVRLKLPDGGRITLYISPLIEDGIIESPLSLISR